MHTAAAIEGPDLEGKGVMCERGKGYPREEVGQEGDTPGKRWGKKGIPQGRGGASKGYPREEVGQEGDTPGKRWGKQRDTPGKRWGK